MLNPYETLENTCLEPFCKFSEKIENLMYSVAYEGLSEDTESLAALPRKMLGYYFDCWSEVEEKKKTLGRADTPAQINEINRITFLYKTFAYSVETAVSGMSKGKNIDCIKDSLEKYTDFLIRKLILN